MGSVVITGASKGIGRATAVEFARRGHRVVATARDPRSLADLDVDQRLALDVTDLEEVAASVVDAAEAAELPLRIPIGAAAEAILAARGAAPDTVPFIPVQHPQPVPGD